MSLTSLISLISLSLPKGSTPEPTRTFDLLPYSIVDPKLKG